jgi:peptide/nickel transport system ATP-binding protein
VSASTIATSGYGDPREAVDGEPGGLPLLTVDSLSVSFPSRQGDIRAVRDVSLALAPGECLAVVGESGSGKSVTARSLLGLTGPTARVTARGIAFEGHDLLGLDDRGWRQVRGGRIGFVLQDALTSLDPLRRVGAEVAEPLEVHGLADRRQRPERVVALLADVGIPDPEVRARQYPHELSGGLRQRALIASAIAAEPTLVIADEPTTALDVTVQAQVLDLLSTKRDQGTAVLLISHDLAVVSRMADRIAVMYAGLIVEEGPAAELLAHPRHPYTVDLLAAAPSLDDAAMQRSSHSPGGLLLPDDGPGCPYASRCPLADDRCRRQLPALSVVEPVGVGSTGGSTEASARRESAPVDPVPRVRCWRPGQHRVELVRRLRPPPVGEAGTATPVIEAEGVTKRFRSPDGSWRTAVDDLSFTLQAGEALGVVGESGSGKTTTAQIVMGMLSPDAGEVRLDGGPWSQLAERDRRPRRSRIQIVHQDPLSSFDPRFTVDRILGEALGRPGRRGTSTHRERIVELLGQVGLDESFTTRRGASLSGGQRQRVAIARALAPGPDVIVCDEPVSALDVSVQAQILDLFASLRTEVGVALLFISHDLGVVRQVCDHVLVMREGSVVERGTVDTVFTRPQHPYTQALLAALPRPDRPPTLHPSTLLTSIGAS